MKTPFEFVASAVRAASVDSVNAMPLVQAMRELGMPPYQCQPPTGYADRADAWVNTGALLNRMNFAVALTEGRVRNGRGAAPLRNTSTESARDEIVDQVLGGDLSSSTDSSQASPDAGGRTVARFAGVPER